MSSTQNTIPKEWQRVKLGDITNITNGKTNTQDAVVNGEYPLFDRSVLIKRSSKYLFDNTAIILPGEGSDFVPRYYSGKFDLHQRAYAIFPNEGIFPFFLFQYLYANKDLFVQKSVGSTVRSLRLPIIQSIDVLLPPLDEQKKIAEILSTVDLEIEKTEEIILQTERLKSGLTQKLFTKGISPKKFKSTKLGNIPEDWSVVSIKDAPLQLIDGDLGVNYPKLSDFSSGGYCLFLNNKNIKDDHFVFSNMQFISREKDESLRKGKLKRFDVVLTTRGTVGNVAFYDEKVTFENIRINSGMILLRAFEDLSPSFLYHLMKSPLMKKRYSDVASGSAQPQLPIRSLEQIYIPIPPEDVQEEIVNICETLDVKVLENTQYKEYLTSLKKGLMQDLLSGKVRTK